jgi:signal transduction histidine kinase
MIRIFLADSEQPKQDQTDEIVRHLDELRSEFFLDLSHQLRTPITAMKLAMDGLFAQLRDVLSPPQRKLARISRRNIERIVSLVENQLDLLQMLSGERRVCRRLTDLDLLLRELPRRPFAAAGGGGPNGYRPRVERADALEDTGPLYVFTDPEHLVAVIDCIVGVGPPNAKRSIRVDYDESDRCYQLGISVDCVGQGTAGRFGGHGKVRVEQGSTNSPAALPGVRRRQRPPRTVPQTAI